MASCSRCNAPNADLFSPTGDLLCRFCFNVAQNARADARARESLEREAPPGFVVAGTGAPPTSSRALIVGGFAVMGCAVAFTLVIAVLFDRIYPVWTGMLLLGGAAAVLRGFAQRRR
jgi:hypothetical protein